MPKQANAALLCHPLFRNAMSRPTEATKKKRPNAKSQPPDRQYAPNTQAAVKPAPIHIRFRMVLPSLSSGESNTDSPTAVFLFVFFLIFLGLRQQAFVICAEIQSKNLCCGVRSSFGRADFCQVKENHAGNTRWYFQVIFRRIGGNQPAQNLSGFNSPLLTASLGRTDTCAPSAPP